MEGCNPSSTKVANGYLAVDILNAAAAATGAITMVMAKYDPKNAM